MSRYPDIDPDDYWVYYDHKSISSPPTQVWSKYPYFLETDDLSDTKQERLLALGLKFIIFEAMHTGVESYFAFTTETDYNVAVLIS